MAPAYRSHTVVTTTAQPQTVNKPAGVVDGDLLIFFGCGETSGRNFTVLAGWTALAGTGLNANGGIDDGTDSMGQAFYKIAASEPSSWSFASVLVQTGVCGVVAYSGVDGTTPINVAAARAWTTGTAAATPTITPGVNGCLLVGFFTADETTASSWTPPGTMNERWDVQETGFFEVCSVADELQTTAAAVTRTATLATSDTGTAFLIALAPAAAAAATSLPPRRQPWRMIRR